jgi:hypothetical protein
MGARMKLTDAQQAALAALADENGDFDADLIWQSARAPTSPLHDLFNWDVDQAAVAHWRHVARQIVASCRVEVIRRHISFEVPRWVRNPDKPYFTQGYSLTEQIANDADRARATLEAELIRTEAAIQRAMNLARYFDFNLVANFNAMLAAIASIRVQMSGGPPPPPPPPSGGRRDRRSPPPPLA